MELSTDFTLLAIGSALLASIANILARTLLKDLKSKNIVGINFLTMAATLLVVSPVFYFFEPSPKSVMLLLVVSLVDTVANYFYFKTFEKTEATVATPILSLAPIFTFVFGWILLGEKVSATTLLLSGIIVVLIVWFSSSKKEFHQFKLDTLKPALAASFLFGISAIPAKEILFNEASINAPTLYMFRAALIALFSLIFFNFQTKGITPKQYRLIFIRGLFVIGQWLLLYFALTIGNSGVTITLANITPIFVFVLGAIFLREQVTTKKLLAAISVLILSLLL